MVYKITVLFDTETLVINLLPVLDAAALVVFFGISVSETTQR